MLLCLQKLHSLSIASLRGVLAYLLCCQLVLASEAIDLFTVTIDVESESRQERIVASRAALKILLIRVTGDKSALSAYPLLATSVENAQRYIASFSYQTVLIKPVVDTANTLSSAVDDEPAFLLENPSSILLASNTPLNSDSALNNNAVTTQADIPKAQEVLRLNIVFQADAIKELLRQAVAPFWQANRPGVLVWLVEQSGDQRRMINADIAPDIFRALDRGAEARGVPLIQPLLDLEEASLISASDIWDLSVATINLASNRYDNGAVLVGKFSQAYDKSWFGQWMLLYKGERQVEHYRGNALADYFIQGSDMVADRLAADYAVAGNQEQMSKSLTIKFSGIRNPADYLALSEYLRQVPALKTIQLSHVDGEHCYFSLDGSNDVAQLRALIELNKRLVPAGINSRDKFLSNQLHYQWLDRR
ncbi:MAG: DUF2066 domain-containing protein [Cellvibrionales bacterium]|nr:DUF2066 domain-containing protein [Cellvibrionales bacterium]